MTKTSTPSKFLGDEFNPFLFAYIGTDRSGAQLSVVSALARLDLDAWAEAAFLARLPREAAASKLSVLLQKFTEIPRIVQDSGAIAARLIALLPSRAAPASRLAGIPAGHNAYASAAVFAVVFVLSLLAGQLLFNHTNPHQAAAIPTTVMSAPPASAASAPAAGTPP